MTIHDEIIQALAQLDQARQNFDYATPDFIDVAVAELAAAEVRVDLLYCLAKRLEGNPLWRLRQLRLSNRMQRA